MSVGDSHIATGEPYAEVVFIYVQVVTHEELDLWTKVGQLEHKKAPEVPKVVVCFPNGREHVALH